MHSSPSMRLRVPLQEGVIRAPGRRTCLCQTLTKNQKTRTFLHETHGKHYEHAAR